MSNQKSRIYVSLHPLIPQKPALFLSVFKCIGPSRISHNKFLALVHNFGGENKLDNAENLSWLMGLGPIHLNIFSKNNAVF